MSEPNKRRASSFRKLLPSFFSNKAKNRNENSLNKYGTSGKFDPMKCSNMNTYTDPCKMYPKKPDTPKLYSDSCDSSVSDDIIYENLRYTNHDTCNISDIIDSDIRTSSSSTLVSENASNKVSPHDTGNVPYRYYVTTSETKGNSAPNDNSPKRKLNLSQASPQVPSVPQQPENSNSDKSKGHYYYHNLDYRSTNAIESTASSVINNNYYPNSSAPLHSVGAEIKTFSTQFSVSPKKESDVRLNKQLRAKSLSPQMEQKVKYENHIEKPELMSSEKKYRDSVNKPYYYSAPASPIYNSNKIPNMPKIHLKSLCEHKSINNGEKSIRQYDSQILNKPLLIPHKDDIIIGKLTSKSNILPYKANMDSSSQDMIDKRISKEKTRQNVEAFYWQRLKQLKEKEEQYLIKQSLDSSINVVAPTYLLPQSASRTLTPQPDCRSFSLPKGTCVENYKVPTPIEKIRTMNEKQLFTRGSPGRNTIGAIQNSSYSKCFYNSDIVLRHPEKMSFFNEISHGSSDCDRKSPIFQRGTLNSNSIFFTNGDHRIKRVSFQRINENQVSIYRNVNATDESIQEVTRDSRSSETPKLKQAEDDTNVSSWTTATATAKILLNRKAKTEVGAVQPRAMYSESESGSDTSEIQRIMRNARNKDDECRDDSILSDVEPGRVPVRGRQSRRDDPRRHTLAGNHHYTHSYHPQQLSALDLEHAMSRGYQPPSNAMFDDDPGIMSEVETSSTGFRRGGKQRSSLPVVRTPSKTLERPLGLVFLQFRSETKRALLPNEITSIDTVKALFVRSFSHQLNMHYMDSPLVKIYIHDSSKDMFYELEDMRAHLRDIRDRSVLRLFELVEMGGGGFPGALNVGAVAMPVGAAGCSGPSSWDQDQSYFSEPEIDSEYHHQHIHKSKAKVAPQAYYMGPTAPSTLPRGGHLLRAYSPATPPIPADRVKSLPAGAGHHVSDAYVASPERVHPRGSYEDPYYTQYMGAPRTIGSTKVIDEEASEIPLEDQYAMYPHNPNVTTTQPRPVARAPFNNASEAPLEDQYAMYPHNPNVTTAQPRPVARATFNNARITPENEMRRMRVEGDRLMDVERQLANLTGLVQVLVAPGSSGAAPGTAAAAAGPPPAPRLSLEYPYRAHPQDDTEEYANTTAQRAPKLGKDRYQKSVSFEKSVSFSDDPPGMNSPKQHSPIHPADTKPPKPAIKSSTLPRTSSQERGDRLKPAPPPKPVGLTAPPPPQAVASTSSQRGFPVVPVDFGHQLRVMEKSSNDLLHELRNMKRTTIAHAADMRSDIQDTARKVTAIADAYYCRERSDVREAMRLLSICRAEILSIEGDLYETETTVESLREQAAMNRDLRVPMTDVERIANILSHSTQVISEWQKRFPDIAEVLKGNIALDMDKLVRKEKVLDEESNRMELDLRRCKKLTGTLVTLKRLACVQDQRLPPPVDQACHSPVSSRSSHGFASSEGGPSDSDAVACPFPRPNPKVLVDVGERVAREFGQVEELSKDSRLQQRPENALDALLDELQTFAKPPADRSSRPLPGEPSLRRLHSYPSGSDTDASPPVRARHQPCAKPPIPERHPELLALATRRAPPPPPPRTTSRSPLASPTSPSSPIRHVQPALSPQHSSSCESVNSQEGASKNKNGTRHVVLEQRHQELLKKQKALQEQYARLQMIQRSSNSLPVTTVPDLKKTGSESNLLSKMNLNVAPTTTVSGSLTHLAPGEVKSSEIIHAEPSSTTSKVYETDIL